MYSLFTWPHQLATHTNITTATSKTTLVTWAREDLKVSSSESLETSWALRLSLSLVNWPTWCQFVGLQVVRCQPDGHSEMCIADTYSKIERKKGQKGGTEG